MKLYAIISMTLILLLAYYSVKYRYTRLISVIFVFKIWYFILLIKKISHIEINSLISKTDFVDCAVADLN